MKPKHTPGPWEFDAELCAVFPPINISGVAIAQVTVTNAQGLQTNKTREVGEANARLIASAPDLLAFAKHVLQSGACQGIPGLEGYCHLVIATALGGPTEPSQERAEFVRKATGGES